MNLQEIETLFESGITKMVATLDDGSKMNLRLFRGVNTKDLCYMRKGSRRFGYRLSNLIPRIESVKYSGNKKEQLSVVQKEVEMLRKFKKAFTTTIHKNLWGDMQDGYSRLNISEFELVMAGAEDYPKTSYDVYTHLSKFSRDNNLHLITENNYKTTTIKSQKPVEQERQYTSCVDNIARHLDNKENFSYHWRSKYDVSVSGKLCDDGVYRAWLSLEFKGCGNGHYYLLINENTAVFSEDD